LGVLHGDAGESGGDAQVFNRRKLFLERIMMAKIENILAVFVAQAGNRLVLPANLTGLRGGQAAEYAQQAGLARAVLARDVQTPARFEREAEVGKKMAVAANTGEINGCKHVWGWVARAELCLITACRGLTRVNNPSPSEKKARAGRAKFQIHLRRRSWRRQVHIIYIPAMQQTIYCHV